MNYKDYAYNLMFNQPPPPPPSDIPPPPPPEPSDYQPTNYAKQHNFQNQPDWHTHKRPTRKTSETQVYDMLSKRMYELSNSLAPQGSSSLNDNWTPTNDSDFIGPIRSNGKKRKKQQKQEEQWPTTGANTYSNGFQAASHGQSYQDSNWSQNSSYYEPASNQQHWPVTVANKNSRGYSMASQETTYQSDNWNQSNYDPEPTYHQQQQQQQWPAAIPNSNSNSFPTSSGSSHIRYAPYNQSTLSGNRGASLLRKMGWQPGEGLGKDQSGPVQALEVRGQTGTNKRGFSSQEELQHHFKKVPPQKQPIGPKVPKVKKLRVEGKHPISILCEYAMQNKYQLPVYVVKSEQGEPHLRTFIFSVKLNGVEYGLPSNTEHHLKKKAKEVAARHCLQQLGVALPP